jgi:hypothetical protein
MKVILRAFALWGALAAAGWSLMHSDPTRLAGIIWGIACLLCLPLAVGLSWVSVAALPESRSWRWAFWSVTAGGWAAVALLVVGHLDGDTHPDDRQVVVAACLAAAAVATWLTVRTKRLLLLQGLRDALAGSAIVALLSGAIYWRYEAKTASLAANAEARWAEIGLPMGEFEKTLAPIPESPGSKVARQAFREILSQRFYKPGTGGAILESVVAPSKEASSLVSLACKVISAKLPPSDEVDLSQLPVEPLETHASSLEENYLRILDTEAPVWACNPLAGPRIDVPNFVGVRMFSQLASAESLRRLAAGDEEGAKLPLEACEKLGTHLESNPTLVALMIHVAVDALLTSQQARLSGTDDDFQAIGRDAARWRDALVRSLQWDAWVMLYRSDDVTHEYADNEGLGTDEGILRNLPAWARPFVGEIYIHRQCALGALHNAEHAAVCRSPRTRTLSDLGAMLHDRISSQDPTICEVNVTRLTRRIHATLLLREQVNLIRTARERLDLGEPVESRDSAVLPRARWEVTPDADRRTVSIRLTNAPRWVYKGDVVGSEFWVLPLDGSVPWQFRAREKTTAAR